MAASFSTSSPLTFVNAAWANAILASRFSDTASQALELVGQEGCVSSHYNDNGAVALGLQNPARQRHALW